MVQSHARIEESQSRWEDQLQQILAVRRATPLLSHSLDASSPEGRQTWMELGRLLREEGITPSAIKENREKLIAAMKNALAESFPESFHTVKEYFSATGSIATPPLDSVTSLGFGPPSPQNGAMFPLSFLERHPSDESSLDRHSNVVTGMDSLMLGMENYDNESSDFEDQEPDLEDLALDLSEPEDCCQTRPQPQPPVLELEVSESRSHLTQHQEGELEASAHEAVQTEASQTEWNKPNIVRAEDIDLTPFMNPFSSRETTARPIVDGVHFESSEDPGLSASKDHTLKSFYERELSNRFRVRSGRSPNDGVCQPRQDPPGEESLASPRSIPITTGAESWGRAELYTSYRERLFDSDFLFDEDHTVTDETQSLIRGPDENDASRPVPAEEAVYLEDSVNSTWDLGSRPDGTQPPLSSLTASVEATETGPARGSSRAVGHRATPGGNASAVAGSQRRVGDRSTPVTDSAAPVCSLDHLHPDSLARGADLRGRGRGG